MENWNRDVPNSDEAEYGSWRLSTFKWTDGSQESTSCDEVEYVNLMGRVWDFWVKLVMKEDRIEGEVDERMVDEWTGYALGQNIEQKGELHIIQRNLAASAEKVLRYDMDNGRGDLRRRKRRESVGC